MKTLYTALVILASVGCAATNPATMTDAQRSAAGIMSRAAEARTEARNKPKCVKSDAPAPLSWIDRTYAKGNK